MRLSASSSLRTSLTPSTSTSTSTSLALTLTLALALLLPGCGDDPAPEGDAAATAATATTGASDDAADPATASGTQPERPSGRERVSEPPRPEPVVLPDAPDLTDDAAQSEITSALTDLAPEEASRASLLYLAGLGDRSIADVVRRELLSRDGGEYDDPAAAALGLEVLLVLGEADAAPEAIALARKLLEEEDEVEGIAFALSRVTGEHAAEADEVLAELANSDFDDTAGAAVEAIAIRGSKAAEAVLPGIVADAERYDALRGTALAAMLMTGHERAATSADALLASDADGSEVIAGLGVAGAAAAVPYIERIMDRALAEGNAGLEFADACYTLAEIYRGTSGAAGARKLIQGWMAQDPGLDGDEATYALWTLGDTSRADAAARLLASEVATAARHDAELAIDLLEEVARRGLARDPRFAKAVNAAAIAPTRENIPGIDLSTQQLRAAAAYAYLRSR